MNRIATVQFLRTAYRPDDWIAVFLKSYQTGQTAQRVIPMVLVCEARFQAWLRWRNLTRWNLYVSVNAVAAHRRSRRRDAVASVRHVFVEADWDGPTILAAIDERPDLPPPSYVLHSSPGRVHVFWRVSGFTTDAVEALQKLLAKQLGTDPAATPCTQMTRLPGFFNHKRQPPHLVTIEYRDTALTLTPNDFPHPISVEPRQLVSHTRTFGSADQVERARRYLSAVPPAVAGQHGDLRTFQVCCRLVRGFELSDDDALALLKAWNAQCVPPWSEPELRDKLRRARTYGREPLGGLLADAS